MTLVIKPQSSGPAVPDDVDLVPVAVVEPPVRSPEPESPAAQVQVQVQEPLEELECKEITLESKNNNYAVTAALSRVISRFFCCTGLATSQY